MTESFGMQLDDDSLLALFSRVMTHPPATVTCYEVLCTLPQYTWLSKNMLPAACSISILACMALRCSNRQQSKPLLVLSGCAPSYGGVPSKLVFLIVIRHSTLCHVCSSNPPTVAVIDQQMHFAICTCTP